MTDILDILSNIRPKIVEAPQYENFFNIRSPRNEEGDSTSIFLRKREDIIEATLKKLNRLVDIHSLPMSLITKIVELLSVKNSDVVNNFRTIEFYRISTEDKELEFSMSIPHQSEFHISIYYEEDSSDDFDAFVRYKDDNGIYIIKNGSIVSIRSLISDLYEKNKKIQ